MSVGIWIFGDQLSLRQAALADLEHRLGAQEARRCCRVVLIESTSLLLRQRPHRQKLVLQWSALRHFGDELVASGWRVDRLEAESFADALHSWIHSHGIRELHAMDVAERPLRHLVTQSLTASAAELIWHASNAFLWSREAFAAWARPYRQLRMELFYREGRKRFGVLMDAQEQPLGGAWNFDQANRKAPPRGLAGPAPLWFAPDGITQAVIAKVQGLEGLPGDLEPFGWGVNRQQALAVLEHFIATRLSGFGPYQDAMVIGQPTMWHSLISPYINLGLLEPLAVIRRLEQAGLEQAVPLACLEGVIRQILGWREYTHGLYWWLGADYPGHNHFEASRSLPAWFEQLGGSGMACIDTVLAELKTNGYAHHIQRLMVLANYGLLAGLDPQALTAWFDRLFIDGYDWVMQTNVLGMGLYADGGVLASKPYAASGNYINRMSTYCKGCRFDVKQRTGPRTCPYNSLYWDFLARHGLQLRGNPRMALMLNQLAKIAPDELVAIREAAAGHLQAAGSLD